MALDYGEPDGGRDVNYWSYDPALQREVGRAFTGSELEYARRRLEEFGGVVGDTVADNSDTVDSNPPELDSYTALGDVANDVRHHPAHVENERLTFEHGAVADCFHAPTDLDEPMPFTYSLCYHYLTCYADIGLACGVSMTAGAALVLQRFADDHDERFEALTSRSYDDLSQGAMYITEVQGGSDVGANETTAEWDADAGCYRVEGEKWFCSNVDAEVPLVLARTPDAAEGTRGLSMFVVPPEHDGEPNDVLFRRLKDKLGTRSVPTAEVEFDGSRGYLVGEEEEGFRYMTAMLNYERVTNAFGSCGITGRAVLEAKSHAAERSAFGETLDSHPLMQADLVDMTVKHEAATAFSFDAARAFDGHYRDDDHDSYRLMRMLVPIAKYRTGELAVETCSYAMEVLGGNGYVETHATERLLRDAQVAPIWEGTSNVLSLDVLRAIAKEAAHEPLLERVDDLVDTVEHPYLDDVVDAIVNWRQRLESSIDTVASSGREHAELHAKRLADEMYTTYAAALLAAEAQRAIDGGDGRLAVVARRFVEMQEEDGVRDDRLETEYYDEIARHESLPPSNLG